MVGSFRLFIMWSVPCLYFRDGLQQVREQFQQIEAGECFLQLVKVRRGGVFRFPHGAEACRGGVFCFPQGAEVRPEGVSLTSYYVCNMKSYH